MSSIAPVRNFIVEGLRALAVLAVMFSFVPNAIARPTYFGALTDKYGFEEGDDLYACGVCHRLWTGTGTRNKYGQSIESQLYLGRTIDLALELVEPLDSDTDGFTNVEELVTYLTLPGYNCTNFTDAINAPLGYDTYITPLVASCLDPHDIAVTPVGRVIHMTQNVGGVRQETVTIYNNGTTEPLHIDSVSFVGGLPTDITVDGPATPHDIPVGGNSTYTVTFVPTVAQFLVEDLRIISDDPDLADQEIDVEIRLIAIVPVLSPGPIQATCLKDISKDFSRYTRTHLRFWGVCETDEAGGKICDSGQRDYRIGRASSVLDGKIGGARDRRCGGLGLKPSLIGYPAVCGGNCESIRTVAMAALPDCLRCRQEDAMTSLLRASVGTAPPDLAPPALTEPAAQACQTRIEKASEKSIAKLFKLRSRCELEAIAAEETSTCDVDTAEAAAKILDKLKKVTDRCASTVGMEGCLFDEPSDPSCLADTVDAIADDLVDATFGFSD